jgi:phosphoglucomutase
MKEMRAELGKAGNKADAAKLIGGPEVLAVRDYEAGIRYEFTETGVNKSEIKLPKSNVLLYELGGEKGLDWACARPSGTEPKLKIYFGVYSSDMKDSEEGLKDIKTKMTAFVDSKL